MVVQDQDIRSQTTPWDCVFFATNSINRPDSVYVHNSLNVHEKPSNRKTLDVTPIRVFRGVRCGG